MNQSVSQTIRSPLRSVERHPGNATGKTSSVVSITPTRGVSPSFRKQFMDLQHELQHLAIENEDQDVEYVRVLQACLSDTRESASPCSRSTACSEDGRPDHAEVCISNTHVILLGNECHNVRLEVSLHKLRTGIMGQQRLIRLHQTETHLELEYSDAIEDLELSCRPVLPSAASTVVYPQGNSRTEPCNTFHQIETPGHTFCNTEVYFNFKAPWIWITTSVISLAAMTLYYRNRSPSLM